MNAYTAFQLHKKLMQMVAGIYPQKESADHIAIRIVEHVTEKRYPLLLLDKDTTLSAEIVNKCTQIATEVAQGVPLQYALGKVYFLDIPIHVRPGVLIPRPETEELMFQLHQRGWLKPHRNYADICCGSGCIAVSIAKLAAPAKVDATDLSDIALETTRENIIMVQEWGSEVTLYKHDQLSKQPHRETPFYGIISNPPYIPERDKATMQPNVLEHEPHEALFVPNNAPLLFYKAILTAYTPWLEKDGFIAFEIDPKGAEELSTFMRKELGYQSVEVIKDMFGRDRFCIGRKTVVDEER